MDPARSATAERAFRVGFFGNGGLAALKLTIGWLAGSRALMADGWHSLSDVALNGGAWIAHRLGKRAPDDDHHYGHGKAEAFSGLVVGMILFVAGAGVCASAFTSKAQLAPDWKGWLALGVAAFSIFANLYFAWISRSAAKTAGSHGLAALARDNASDAFSSILVVVGIVGVQSGFSWAEPVAALLIGLLILWMGWHSCRDGFDVLMDRSDPKLRESLLETARRVDEVRGVQSVRVHPLGASFSVDMEISVDGALTVEEGHRIAHSVEEAVTGRHDSVGQVHVHVNPSQAADPPSPA